MNCSGEEPVVALNFLWKAARQRGEKSRDDQGVLDEASTLQYLRASWIRFRETRGLELGADFEALGNWIDPRLFAGTSKE